MPITIEIPDSTIAQLQARLERLEAFDRGRALTGALRAAGKPVVERWRDLAPKPGRSGYTGPGKGRRKHGKGLSDALTTKAVSWRSVGGATLIVGADYTIAPHEHLVELGHRRVKGGTVARLKPNRAGKYVTPSAAKISRTGKGSVSGDVPGGYYGRTAVETTQGEFEAALWGHIEKEITATVGV